MIISNGNELKKRKKKLVVYKKGVFLGQAKRMIMKMPMTMQAISTRNKKNC